MSIINQALKKAQRERLFHDTQGLPHATRQHALRATRRWPLLVAGLIAALSIGTVLHSWRIMSRPSMVVATAPPDTTAAEKAAMPSLSPVLRPSPPPAPERTAPPPSLNTPLPQKAEPVTPGPTLRPTPALTQERLSAAARSTAVTLTAVPVVPDAQARSQARTLFNQAIEAQKAGDQTQALTLLQQSITLDPDLKAAYNSLGNVYYELQHYDQALQMYQKALEIDPDYAKARNNLGSTYLRLAMDDRAREELLKAIQADGTYGLAYYNLACVYARAGDSTTAAQYLQQAITFEPQARTWARVDDDFARVRTAPEIQPLLGPS